MSEIYRQERAGTAPPMPEDGRCDMATNPLVDDCRGMICDACIEPNAPKDCILGTMVANGGPFSQAIAIAAQRAPNPEAYETLRRAFPHMWHRYAVLWREAQPGGMRSQGYRVGETEGAA